MSTLRSRLLLVSVLLFLLLASASPSWSKDLLPRLGGEQQVNVRTAGPQTAPSIAADAAGNYAVAWIGPDAQDRQTIWVRLFDVTGAPRGGEIQVDQPFTVSESLAPKIAMAPDGRFVISWYATNVFFRLYDAAGTPRGPAVAAWSIAPANVQPLPGDVAMGADGRFLMTFRAGGSVVAQLYDADGAPLEGTQPIGLDSPGAQALEPRALALADGSYLVAWVQQRILESHDQDDEVVATRRPNGTGSWPATLKLNAEPIHVITELSAVAHGDGGFSLTWKSGWGAAIQFLPPPPYRAARRFDAQLSPTTGEVILPFQSSLRPLALAESRDGQTLALADDYRGKPVGKLFDHGWNLVSFLDFPIVTYTRDLQIEPTVAAAKDGFVAAWSSGFVPFLELPPSQDGDTFGIFAQRFAAPVCVAGSKVLCLGDFQTSLDFGRFELRATWKTPDGATGDGHALPISAETGAFWFFQPDNLELVTKVLDGTGVNDRFWVFSGALSDVDYTFKVRDTATGAERTYHNPQGQLVSRADTDAFPGGDGNPAPTAAGSAAASGLVAELAASAEAAGGARSETAPLAACGDAVLCLQIGRELRVGIELIDPRTGVHGTAQAHPLTANTGAFSFFNSGVYEVIVKLLDGGPVNGKTWFFYGGLSNVDYTITLEDPVSHATKTYHNQHGELASRADTRALPAGSVF